MCTPPVSTPPGHHETLRVSRALVRMARNDTRKATSTTNAAPGPGRRRSPNRSMLTTSASSMVLRLAGTGVRCAATVRRLRRDRLLLVAPVGMADVVDRLVLLDRGDGHGAAPQQRDLRQRAAGVLRVEADVVAAVLEVQLAAPAVVGVGDLDVGDAERRVLADQQLADGVALARGDPDPPRVALDVLEGEQPGALADAGGQELAQQGLVVVVAADRPDLIEGLDLAGPRPALALLVIGLGGDPHDLAQDRDPEVVGVDLPVVGLHDRGVELLVLPVLLGGEEEALA